MAATTTTVWSPSYLKAQLATALLNPVRAFRPRYLPLLMVYFAYGALGLIVVAESFWVKKALMLSPAELAELSVWLTLPWTVKMVFGELVDAVPILGSQRRAYVFIGAAFIASGMVLLAGAAGGWLTFATLENLYRLGAFLSILGVVIQDVAADAMSTEVVDRENPDGTPRNKEEVDRELGMVQVLGRLALSFGIFLVAGIAGWIAGVYSYATVFLVGLIVPLVSVSGAALITLKPVDSSPIDWRILGGGLAYGAFVVIPLQPGARVRGLLDGRGQLAAIEVAGRHVGHVRSGVGSPGCQLVRMFPGERLDRKRRTAVGVTFAQHRVDGAPQDPGEALVEPLLGVVARVLGVFRNVVAVRPELSDRLLDLRNRGRDVGQLDDDGLTVVGELA